MISLLSIVEKEILLTSLRSIFRIGNTALFYQISWPVEGASLTALHRLGNRGSAASTMLLAPSGVFSEKKAPGPLRLGRCHRKGL